MLTAQTIKSRRSDVFTFLQTDADGAASDGRASDRACGDSLVHVGDDAQLPEPRKPPAG